jgi:acyl-CoA thioesterase I
MVLGDSISAAYGMNVNQGWVSLLQDKLNAEKYPYAVHNESISGDTSAGGLTRLDQALQRDKPQIVLLELGANDGLRGLSPEAMKSNLAEIVRRCRARGAQVLLLGMKIPPNYGQRYIEQFYVIYGQLAAELHIALVPFILQDVALNSEWMQIDGLHPNALGQAAILQTVWTGLKPLLK